MSVSGQARLVCEESSRVGATVGPRGGKEGVRVVQKCFSAAPYLAMPSNYSVQRSVRRQTTGRREKSGYPPCVTKGSEREERELLSILQMTGDEGPLAQAL